MSNALARGHLSFEMFHAYTNVQDFEEEVDHRWKVANRWLPAVAGPDSETTVAKIVFVDDYSSGEGAHISREEAIKIILNRCDGTALAPDYIAFESDCAATCALLFNDVQAPPAVSSGSFSFNESSDIYDLNFDYLPPNVRTLSENDRLRAAASSDAEHQLSARAQMLRSDIGVRAIVARTEETQDREIVWSCPLLSAWWQLIRLGVLRDLKDPKIPVGGEAGLPAGSWQRQGEDRPRFIGDHTLTILDPSYISVEHVVRVVLSNLVDLNAFPSRRVTRDDADPDSREWLDAISYIFDTK